MLVRIYAFSHLEPCSRLVENSPCRHLRIYMATVVVVEWKDTLSLSAFYRANFQFDLQ